MADPSHDDAGQYEVPDRLDGDGEKLTVPRNTWVRVPGTGIEIARKGTDWVGILRWRLVDTENGETRG